MKICDLSKKSRVCVNGVGMLPVLAFQQNIF